MLQCSHAVLVDRPGHVAHIGETVILLLFGLQDRRSQERHPLVEQSRVAGCGDVVAGDERQEVEIVGDPCADAAARRRVPPVLHVALLELSGGRSQDLRARFLSGAVDEGHRVLQLVAEAERPARLVEPGPAPHAAGKCLVDQPAIEHQVQRGVGRADLDGPEDAIPFSLDLLQRLVLPARPHRKTARAAARLPRSPPGRAKRRPRPPRLAATPARSSARRRGRRARRPGRRAAARPRAAGASGAP